MENEHASTDNNKKEGWERNLLERLAFASLNEQRKARRWNVGFKIFFAVYLLALLGMALSDPRDVKPRGDFTALVELKGIIAPNTPASADYIVSGLRDAFESKAKAIIIRSNSPGGSPVQAGYIYDEIKRLRKAHPKKPVYAVVTDICASGCYYAVAGADRIYASESSIVGSIGVLMDGFGFVDAMKKFGVERRLMTAGKNKGMMDPFSPKNPRHNRHVKKMLNEIHQQFIDVVKEGRGKALKNNKDIFSGLFWTGETARKLGLVDEFASASHVAREVVGAEDIIDFSYRENWIDRISGGIGSAMANTLAGLFVGQGTLR
ncbi:MAG: S49 family peptidase [Proteobacteria bacterium]|nr:S49 family peptidase [Pseudomonadota bacterium]